MAHGVLEWSEKILLEFEVRQFFFLQETHG